MTCYLSIRPMELRALAHQIDKAHTRLTDPGLLADPLVAAEVGDHLARVSALTDSALSAVRSRSAGRSLLDLTDSDRQLDERADRQIACTLGGLYRAAALLAASYDGLLYRDSYSGPSNRAEIERLEDDARGDVDRAVESLHHLGPQLREHASHLEREFVRSAAVVPRGTVPNTAPPRVGETAATAAPATGSHSAPRRGR